jgi:pectin methylesterase-like acyl-CoA thioesterase
MMKTINAFRGAKLALGLIAALTLAACANKPTDENASGFGAGGAATPGILLSTSVTGSSSRPIQPT